MHRSPSSWFGTGCLQRAPPHPAARGFHLSGFGRWCLHRHIRQHARHWPCGLWEIGSASTTSGKPWGSGDLIMRRSSSMCLGGVWNDLQTLDVCFEDLIFGAFFSMAMTKRNRLIGGTDSIYKAYISGLCKGISPQFIWTKIWYVYVPPWSMDPEDLPWIFFFVYLIARIDFRGI